MVDGDAVAGADLWNTDAMAPESRFCICFGDVTELAAEGSAGAVFASENASDDCNDEIEWAERAL